MRHLERPRILVTGAVGQIGSELTMALRNRYGPTQVVAAGHKSPPGSRLRESGPYVSVDVTSRSGLAAAVEAQSIDTIYHMAAVLSAVGEERPQVAWDVNVGGLLNVLEVARERHLARVFVPSSIAVFGPDAPRERTPQETVLFPRTMYGITKVTGELLCEYYVQRFGVDVRGLRYPGIISSETLPGGGTTDYAVEIFYHALKFGRYTCFLGPDTILPMMYMPDCLKATLALMDMDAARLTHHANYNVAAMSFCPRELAQKIQRHIPGFVIEYKPDFRQAIADSWPKSIDDSAARNEWGWQPDYDLEAMVSDMLRRLRRRQDEGNL